MMSCGGRRVEWAAGESNCHNLHHLTHVVASDWRWYKTLEHVRQTKACRNMLYTFNLYLPIFVTLFWNALRCHFVSSFLRVEHMSAHSLLTPCRWALVLAVLSVQALPLVCFLHIAYDIRMYLLRNFGYIIHEFNPWFNYRATEYLAEHGFAKFFTWYDYDLWYPLGRPIGTTIYPGMQMTAVAIWEGMQRVPEFSVPTPWYLDWLKQLSLYLSSAGLWKVPVIPETLTFAPMSVNDICCLIPWFGSLASLFTGLMAYETSRSVNAGVMTAGVMAVIPAHLMRSVGGEFDNEAVAMSAICCTFWLWLRAVRTPNSWPYGVFAGLSCIHMAAAWGGYIFVLNMIGVHALLLTAQGRFHFGLHRAYSIFFIVGTCEALQIPVVGWQPLRSLEQIGPLGVFLGFQALAFCDFWRHRGLFRTTEGFVQFRVAVLCLFVVALAGACVVLYPSGYFGPLSSRIRGLFVKHTRTGNPPVDSVAEHQPAGIYRSYLHLPWTMRCSAGWSAAGTGTTPSTMLLYARRTALLRQDVSFDPRVRPDHFGRLRHLVRLPVGSSVGTVPPVAREEGVCTT